MGQFIGNKSGVGGVVSTMEAKHRQKWNLGAPIYTVPCMPLSTMLAETHLKYVDFFTLDVEGGELAVLQTMDWNVQVCVWVVEQDGQNKTKDAAVTQLLQSQGYIKSRLNLSKA